MAETFEPITTQEDFDKRIKERLDRAENKWKEKYKGYSSPEDVANASNEFQSKIDDLTGKLNEANEKIKTHAGEIEERDKKIKNFESDALKQRVARDKGLGWDAFEFLRGDTEEEISESADKLKKLGIGNEPMRNHEPAEDKDDAYRNLARNLV